MLFSQVLEKAAVLVLCLHTVVESQQALELISNKFHVQTLFLEACSCLRTSLLPLGLCSVDLGCGVSCCREQDGLAWCGGSEKWKD